MSMPFELYPWLAGTACYAAYRLADAARLGRSTGKVGKAELLIDSPESEQSCCEPTEEPCPEPQVSDSREAADGKGRSSRTRRVAVGSVLVLALSVALAVLLGPSHNRDAATAEAPAQQIELVTPTAPDPGHHHDEAAAEAPAHPIVIELVEPTAPNPSHYHDEATAEAPAQQMELVVPTAPDPYIQEGHVEPVAVVGLHRQKMKKGVVGGVAYYKSAYYGDFAIGTPAKNITMVFDTGSGNVIFPSTYCTSETCKAHNRYSMVRSSTGREINAWGRTLAPEEPRSQLGVTFGTGHVESVLIEDIMCAGNVVRRWEEEGGDHRNFDNMSAGELVAVGCQRMKMLAAIEMSDMPFRTFVFDGILGLGLNSLAVTKEFSFMHVLSKALEAGGSSMPHTFSMYLEDDKEGNSEIAFGGWSAKRLDGDLTWNDVYEPHHGHWLLRINKMRVDDEEVPFCADGTCLGVADSGTSLLAVPPTAFPEVFERLRHAAPTDGFCVGGPRLYIELDHMVLELGPEDLAQPEFLRPKRRFDPNSNRTSEAASTRDDVRCKPILMSLAIDGSFAKKLFILGEPILRKYYTVYDTKGIGHGPRIGFGRAVRPPASKLPSLEDDIDQWFYETDDEE